jgi:hypothetical protein
MTRPYPPPLLDVPDVKDFNFDASDRRRVARNLGLADLTPDLADAIAHAIACYLATSNGNRDTTVGTTIAALAQLSRPGRVYDGAVARFADDRYGVDYTTHSQLQPLARAVTSGNLGARAALEAAARARTVELRAHPRIAPDTEVLRFFCGVLRMIFADAASLDTARTWHNCRRFALEVLAIAGVEHANFDSHPERLDEYLATEIGPL